MELIKTNENFNFKDKAENGWVCNGNVSNDVEGRVSLNLSVNTEMGDMIGRVSYNKTVDGRANLSYYDITELDRDAFTTYIDSVLDFVLKEFNN